MRVIIIIIIIGGWDTHYHVSLSAVFPFVCLHQWLCVRFDVAISSRVFSLYWHRRYYRYCSRLSQWLLMGDDAAGAAISTPCLLLTVECGRHENVWCCMRLTHPNVNSNSHWQFVIISSARNLWWCHLFCPRMWAKSVSNEKTNPIVSFAVLIYRHRPRRCRNTWYQYEMKIYCQS